jgi:hypothetical protein
MAQTAKRRPHQRKRTVADRLAAFDAAFGSMTDVPTSVDLYLHDKHRETRKEAAKERANDRRRTSRTSR